MKFAHIADTHIRNLKYHYEYRKVFEEMYKILREEKVDCIIHCGDLAHTKTQLSPEYFDMAQWFLKSLADIAPVYIIPGNHDGNLKNDNRQDAITPIVEALDHSNLNFFKKSCEVELSDKFSLNVLSIFDEDNWIKPSDPNKINIAVHHGSISGCQTDLNWTMEHGDNDIEIFEGHDYVFLGDIHKTNQVLDDNGRIRYCGSTIQQNHGETNDKGFLVWDIKDKENFAVKHLSVPNPKPFVTIELTPKGRLPKKTNVPENARLRIVSNNNVPLNKIRKAVDVAKTSFKPESITFLNRAAGRRGSVEELTKNFMKEDLRDIAVQENFIKEYLKDYKPNNDVLQKVLEFNTKYNTIIEQEEDVIRNVNWKISSIEWDNLFNYGEGNKLNFKKLEGIVGIFGKNYSGKSSIVDSMLYTLYNSTSKNNRKNLHVINQDKDFCKAKINIEVTDKIYTITRDSEKYEKTLHGETTLEAKTNVDFSRKCNVSGGEESLNGISRNDTDKNIRKIFGTFEDFMLTSMSSQIDSLSFIKEGSTKRKEILAKFLDLEIFDKKYKMAKEDAVDLRAALKRLEEKNFDEELKEVEEQVELNESATEEQKTKCVLIEQQISDLKTKSYEVETKINSIPADIINIDEIICNLKNNTNDLTTLKANIKTDEKAIKEKNTFLQKVEGFKKDFDVETFETKKEIIIENKKKLDEITGNINLEENRLLNIKKKIKLLEEVPCGPKYSHCKFIKDAYSAQENVDIFQKALQRLKESEKDIEGKVIELEPEKVEEYLQKYNQLLTKQQDANTEISQLSLNIEKMKSQCISLNHKIENYNKKIVEYEENKEAIDNFENLFNEKHRIKEKIEEHTDELKYCKNNLLELYKLHGSLEQQFKNLQDQKQELALLRENFAAYDLFMKCVHPNGIPYDIIKKRLPLINEEVAKILTNIVNFEILFEAKEKKLEIFIKHPKFDVRPIELGSGAEKTIAAMAIRLALLGVSNLPKPDLFILDEPGTSLDEDNMEGFVRILTDMIKTSFKTVLLISHLDSLKDCVDTTIEIEKNDSLAYVNQ